MRGNPKTTDGTQGLGAAPAVTFVAFAATTAATDGGRLPALTSFYAPSIFLEIFPMLSIFRRLMKSEKGATAIEYTLIASLIAVAAIVAMTNVGTKVNGVLSNVASSMN